MLAQTFVIAASLALGQAPTSDETAVREVVGQIVEAWNAKDANALAAVYTTDADYVTSRGTRLVGRENLAKWLRERFKLDAYRDSRQKRMDVSVRFLSPTVALADSTWELTGVRGADGKELPARKGNSTMVLVKKEGQWRTAALRAMVPAKD